MGSVAACPPLVHVDIEDIGDAGPLRLWSKGRREVPRAVRSACGAGWNAPSLTPRRCC